MNENNYEQLNEELNKCYDRPDKDECLCKVIDCICKNQLEQLVLPELPELLVFKALQVPLVLKVQQELLVLLVPLVLKVQLEQLVLLVLPELLVFKALQVPLVLKVRLEQLVLPELLVLLVRPELLVRPVQQVLPELRQKTSTVMPWFMTKQIPLFLLVNQ